MHKTLLLPFLILLSVSTALSGGLTVTVTQSHDVEEGLILDLGKWALDPTNPTGCNSADCCVSPTTDAECEDLAKSFFSNQTYWVQRIFGCIQGDSDWQCQIEVRGNQQIMYCQIVPATDTVREEDVARCASKLALVNF